MNDLNIKGHSFIKNMNYTTFDSYFCINCKISYIPATFEILMTTTLELMGYTVGYNNLLTCDEYIIKNIIE